MQVEEEEPIRQPGSQSYALANSLQKAYQGSNWRLSSEQVGGTECSFV